MSDSGKLETLVELRKQKKLSQQEVADYLEISRQAYCNYEIGKRMPDYETLLKLGEYFNVSVDYLLRGIEKEPLGDPADELIAAYGEVKDHLTEDDIADIKTLMRLRAELHRGE